MDSCNATYYLAGAYLLMAILAVLFTLRPMVTLFHFWQLTAAITFGFRPMLAASNGGYTNYPTGIGWYAYNYGLLYELIFGFCFSAIYILFYTVRKTRTQPIERTPDPNYFYAIFFVGTIAVCVLQVISGGSWLPGARESTMDAASSGTKLVFPVAIMTFSVIIPLAYMLYTRRAKSISRWVIIAVVAVSFGFLSLLFVRGMAISGVILIFWLLEKERKLKFWHLGLALIIMFSIGSLLRPLGALVAAKLAPKSEATVKEQIITEVAKNLTFMDKVKIVFLFTTNNDLADSWPVVIDYVERNGHTNGRTYLGIPMRFAGTRTRLTSGMLTASDTLNQFFYGEDYERLSFGFGVTMANELYMNFGVLGLIFGVIPGILMWAADTWMRRIRVLSSSALFMAYMFYTYSFTGEPATTIQWCVGLLLVAIVVEILARVRLMPRYINKETLSPSV